MNRDFTHRGEPMACWLLLALLALLPCTAWAGHPAQFDYDSDPSVAVLTYTQVHAMLADPDPTPLLRIFGDGRVSVHYPKIMRLAGDYELRLTSGELEELLAAMIAKGIPSFDTDRTKSLRQVAAAAKRKATGQLYSRSDETWTVIELNLTRYSEKSAQPAPLTKKITWKDLPWDAKRFPDVAPLRDLAAAEAQLRELLERDDLLEVRQ